jgi:hypothetical protein
MHKRSEITTETAGKKDIPRPPATASSHPSQPLLELSLLGHQPVPDRPEKTRQQKSLRKEFLISNNAHSSLKRTIHIPAKK